ncbi:hypothetical protein [Enterobacter vonholyi]|uniref:hypothetical protein n=1 Tax=Enterobacter vonholyi TaxID=2797505 RepID=UPI002DBEEE3B|nr:hypothetical protein [Enterobacter vonholyi]MEB5980771.1 hypothetical protein [Enterobacter vonholyi]
MTNDKKIASQYEISEILKYASKRVADQKLVTGTSVVDEKGSAVSGAAGLIAAATKHRNSLAHGYVEEAKNSIMRRIIEKRKDTKDINSMFKDAFKESKKIG